MAERFTFDKEPHGAGGFAKVIKGRDNTLERDIAVKVLDPLVTKFPQADQERFKREARILAKLSHPNIPAIYDVEFGPKSFLIIFQFIEGQTLRQLIESDGPCQISEAKTWFHQIASALEYAHSLGIVHRDVKPDNIIVRPDRESAYLVDFGIALSAEEAKRITQSGLVLGTPGYMSPEQERGEKVTAASDMYSLGVSLYEALSGRRIPPGEYEDLSAASEAIPPQIDELIRDCIQPPERRITSAREFLSRLAGAVSAAKPLSDVLAHGRLHELASALEPLSPTELARLPAGQRALILAKLSDIVASGDPNLHFAAEQFLDLLLSRALHLDKEDYRDVVGPAIDWAFEKESPNGYVGSNRIRRTLEEAAYSSRADAHEVLREEFGEFLKDKNLLDKEEWYLHGARKVLQTLLANPTCTTGAGDLVDALKKVNAAQRTRRGAAS